MPQRLVFSGKDQVELQEFTRDPVGPGQVAAHAICSQMSTGTETIAFTRNFSPGTHWERYVKYPFYPGYSWIGRVTELGPGVTDLSVGQLIGLRKGHASDHVAPVEKCTPVPDGVDLNVAAWFALAKIAGMGARAAQYRLGDSLMIVGAGPIGQMTLRWAAAAGCYPVIVVDAWTERLELARRGGATAAIGLPIDQAGPAIKDANRGARPRVVIDTTGNQQVLAAALGMTADHGRVVLLGDTGKPGDQHLTWDVLDRGLTIIGVHDRHEQPDWTLPIVVRLFFNLIKAGRIDMTGMNTHTFKPAKAADAYQTVLTERKTTMGVIFDWT